MGLTQALDTAASGIRVTQAGLQIVAGNVANAQTPGYVRKTLNQSSTAAGGEVIGVNVTGVNRELDQFVQRQLRIETSGGAYADLKTQFYQRLQDIYGDPTSSSSIETLFGNFTNALQALTTNPTDYSARAGVLSSAQVLTQQLNGLTNDIQGLRTDADLGIADAVRTANQALQAIAQLNGQLSTPQANDSATAQLLDQRDNYIDQLSQLMDIRVADVGNNQVQIFTSAGVQLVGLKAAQLSFNSQGPLSAQALWNADPTKSGAATINLIAPDGTSVDLLANGALRSGKLAALVEMRDTILPQAQSQIDEFAAAMSQALSDQTTNGTAVTAGAQSGFDVDVGGLLAGNTIRITYTDTATSTQHTVTVVRVDDPAALPLQDTATTDPNDKVIGVDWSGGLSSVVSQLNAAFNGRLQFSNPSGSTLRILDDGFAGTTDVNAVTATSTVSGLTNGAAQLPFFTDGTVPFSGAISSTGPQSIGFAGRISVNPALLADPSKLVTYQATTASGDQTRPNFLYDQLTSATLDFSPQTGIGTASAPFAGTLSSFLRQAMSQQSDAANAAKSLSDGQDVVVNALQQRLNDTSGVNMDQEMSNLLVLQTAYGANARVLSAIKDMMNTLLSI